VPSWPGLLNRSKIYPKLKACCLTTIGKRLRIWAFSLTPAQAIELETKYKQEHTLTQMHRNLQPTFNIPQGVCIQSNLNDKYDSHKAYTPDTSSNLQYVTIRFIALSRSATCETVVVSPATVLCTDQWPAWHLYHKCKHPKILSSNKKKTTAITSPWTHLSTTPTMKTCKSVAPTTWVREGLKEHQLQQESSQLLLMT